jgi:hypothetical protein
MFVTQELTPAEREVVETVGHQLSAAYRELRGYFGLAAADRVALTSVLGGGREDA